MRLWYRSAPGPTERCIDTFVQLVSLDCRGLIAIVDTPYPKSARESPLPHLMASAERELGAFIKAVTDCFGPEQARLAAEDWLEEFDSKETLPGLGGYDWRSITIAAASRLATRVNAASRDTKVSPIPSSNCLDSKRRA